MVPLDIARDPLAFDKGRAKENESVWRTRNIGRVALLCVGGACGGRHGRGGLVLGGAITGERVSGSRRKVDNRSKIGNSKSGSAFHHVGIACSAISADHSPGQYHCRKSCRAAPTPCAYPCSYSQYVSPCAPAARTRARAATNPISETLPACTPLSKN